MYVAKERGGVRCEVSTDGRRAFAAERLELETDLRQAEARGELRLVFQPIVDMETETIRSVEALLRWDHPSRGEVPPAIA
jgi:predicted signal transduction protein with EAL and GGDEF domain